MYLKLFKIFEKIFKITYFTLYIKFILMILLSNISLYLLPSNRNLVDASDSQLVLTRKRFQLIREITNKFISYIGHMVNR